MVTEFGIEERRVDGSTSVVSVTGDIDLFTAPELRQRVFAAVSRGTRRVVVDLSETTFIDSAGLGVLIAAHRRLEPRGALIVVCDHDSIVKTFRITGLDGVFTLVPSLDGVVGDVVGARG